MNREEHDENYYKIKAQLGLKEYVFISQAGQRYFIILGKDLKDAEDNFMRMDIMKRVGFTLEDLPVRLEYNEGKCKDWSMDTFRDNNENLEYRNKYRH